MAELEMVNLAGGAVTPREVLSGPWITVRDLVGAATDYTDGTAVALAIVVLVLFLAACVLAIKSTWSTARRSLPPAPHSQRAGEETAAGTRYRPGR